MFDTVFYTMLEFDLFTKSWAYIFMGVTVITMLGFWLFVTGRDED